VRRLRTHQAELGADQAWKCHCGRLGVGDKARVEHLAAAAKAQLGRLDTGRAWALVTLSTRSRHERHAVRMLGHRWFRDPGLRPYLRPFYDGLGDLAIVVDWDDLAYALTTSRFADHEALLPMQVAASLMGVYEMKLWSLTRLHDRDDRANAREVFAEILREDV
jgi:hypothetical protein